MTIRYIKWSVGRSVRLSGGQIVVASLKVNTDRDLEDRLKWVDGTETNKLEAKTAASSIWI